MRFGRLFRGDRHARAVRDRVGAESVAIACPDWPTPWPWKNSATSTGPRLLLEKIVADPEVGVDAWYGIGMIQKNREDWDAASRTLLAAAEKYARHKLAQAMRFQGGDALLRAGHTTEAIEQFDRVLASAEGDRSWKDDAARGKIQAAMQAKDHATVDREAAAFSERFSDSPLRTDVERLLGRSLVTRKQYARAVKTLEPLLREKATEQEALEDRYLLALAHEGCRRHEDALALLPPVLAGGSGRLKADAWWTQASLLMGMKRFADAVEPLEQFLATQPTGDRAIKGKAQLAVCFARSGQIAKGKKFARCVARKTCHRRGLRADRRAAGRSGLRGG